MTSRHMQSLDPQTLGAAREREARQLGLQGHTTSPQSRVKSPISFVSGAVDGLSSFDLHERALKAHPCSQERMDGELDAMIKERIEQLECSEEDSSPQDAFGSLPNRPFEGYQSHKESPSPAMGQQQEPWWERD
jgi:hypothetical protein